MSIKLILLRSGETVISDAKELVSDEKIVGYLLGNPYKINTQKSLNSILLTEEEGQKDSMVEITLSPWILLTSNKQIPIKPDWVVTVVEPLDSVREMYEEKVGTTQVNEVNVNDENN